MHSCIFISIFLFGLRYLVAEEATHPTMSAEKLQSFRKTLESAKDKVKEILHGFDKRWKIKEFPNFHKSAAMTHTGWEVMKVCEYNLSHIHTNYT